ncbi:potassium channel family protein [Synechocystis salina]|uniref:Potassium channel protein n=1 Tax=Synechocystis salina LEGE 00031 TaxID=1828736 RepID=A0ABR9VPD8_9SYNC|nr:potassium channel protein [Synechocystis salina]MBE9239917.1 potassium channel protein [Synechocystis salina LEGE 00041]MBE9253200.1 potassium channel protein [Synechocystis salina LEGE 00031]
MQNSNQRLKLGVLFFAVTLVLATLGYICFGWTTTEAVYMVVITVFGVGYGEVRPLTTPAERLFTMGVILAGTTSAVYIVGAFVQMVTEGEIHRALGNQQRQRQIANLTDHTIICGFGRMGQVLAKQLKQSGLPFGIIDNQPSQVAIAESLGYLAHCGDATREEQLQMLGVMKAQTLATVLPEDATNVFITLTARELNARLTILARGEIPETERKLRLAGADQVILPLTVGAIQMADLITQSNRRDFLHRPDERGFLNDLLASVEVQMDELIVAPDSPAMGRTIMEMEVRSKGAFIVIALRRADGSTILHPHPSQILNENDTIIVIGHRSEIPRFAEQYQFKRKQLKARWQEAALTP